MKIFDNPYHYSAVIASRIAVSIATFIWSLIVLIKINALGTFVTYAIILQYIHEDVVAAFLMIISVGNIYRLVRQCRPVFIGISSYAILTLFWMYVWWGIVINPGPIWPASFSSVSVIVILSLYAFISNPKRHE